MKLVIATPLYPPEIGGPATYAKLLAEGLPAKGIEVELVKFSEIRRLPKIIRHYAYYRRVLHAAQNADVVLALDPASVGLPALRAAQKAGKPFVVKIVGDYAWEQGQQRFGVTQDLDEFVKEKHLSFPVSLFRRLQTLVARNAVKVIVPSHYLKSIVSNGWGIPEEKIEVIYNAVAIESIGKLPKDVTKLPRPFVVSVGRLVPWKRFEGVIDAVTQVPQFSLVIVGDGPGRRSLREHAHNKLGARCLFTGQLSHADTLAVMKESAALVLNSTYEGLSHVLIEAQMLGIPAIVTDAGGNPEVITNGLNGLKIKTNDANALQNALADFAHVDRSHMSGLARENSKRFSVGTMLTRTSDVLTNV
jgi:glycosyltransferase involved in cell wall biosynthesis